MNRGNEVIIEEKVLSELRDGSLEQTISLVEEAVRESDKFGNSPNPFSTHEKKVIVYNEDNEFFSARYYIEDGGIVKLSHVKPLDVGALKKEDVASRGVDGFMEGISLRESLLGLVQIIGQEAPVPLADMEVKVDRLFAGGGIWRKHLGENKDKIAAFGWDADYGDLKVENEPLFTNSTKEELEEGRPELIAALARLEKRLANVQAKTSESFKKYQGKTQSPHDPNDSNVLVQFESFCQDYLSHSAKVLELVSEAIRDSGEGCVECSAFVHDQVIMRMRELELGGRFIQKVSAEF